MNRFNAMRYRLSDKPCFSVRHRGYTYLTVNLLSILPNIETHMVHTSLNASYVIQKLLVRGLYGF